MTSQDNYRAVLWVRHCFGCHNKVKFQAKNPLTYAKFIPYTSSEQQAYKIPSYCTAELGEIQSLIFGYRLKNLIGKLDIKESINKFAGEEVFPNSFVTINLYSSVLPRAMETAKLISKETNIENLSNKNDEIKRINFIQEKIEKNGDLVNSTTLHNSNDAVDILNTEFTKGRGYCLISKQTPIAATQEDIEFKTQDKEEIKKNYKAFKSQVLKELPYNKLNLIVSHSSFLKHALDFDPLDEGKKMENLDAYLIIYEKKEGPLWEEILKLRRLYLFAENKIIKPDKAGKLNPPIRDDRKKDIEKNHELMKSFGFLRPEKLIYKTLGECKNEEIKKSDKRGGRLRETGLFCQESSPITVMNTITRGISKNKISKKKKSKKKKSKKKKSKKKKSKKKNSKKKKSKKKNSKKKNSLSGTVL